MQDKFMASSRIKIKSPRAKDGLCPLVIVYSYNRSKRTELSTGITISNDEWDSFKNKVKRKHPKHDLYNNAIQELLLKLEQLLIDLRRKGIDPTKEIVKGMFEGNMDEETNDIFILLDRHIEMVAMQKSNNTLKDFKALRTYLKNFEKHRKRTIFFHEINYNFYEELLAFLRFHVVKRNGEKGLADSSVGKYVKNLRLFLKRSYQREYIDYINTEDWKVFTSEGDHVYVTQEELDALMKIDFSENKKLDQIRDLFVVACETGLRWSDFSCISPYAIKERTIELKSKKTETFVRIPIHPRLRKILNKHDNNLPVLKNLAVFNVQIKKICQTAGIDEMIQQTHRKAGKLHEKWTAKYQLVSAHTGRRSFCTNSYMNGMDKDLIMSISGHSSEKMLMRYVKVSKEKIVLDKLERHLEGLGYNTPNSGNS